MRCLTSQKMTGARQTIAGILSGLSYNGKVSGRQRVLPSLIACNCLVQALGCWHYRLGDSKAWRKGCEHSLFKTRGTNDIAELPGAI